jgi:hypothetical protein
MSLSLQLQNASSDPAPRAGATSTTIDLYSTGRATVAFFCLSSPHSNHRAIQIEILALEGGGDTVLPCSALQSRPIWKVQADSRLRKIKRLGSFLFNSFAQSVLENSAILFSLIKGINSGRRESTWYPSICISRKMSDNAGRGSILSARWRRADLRNGTIFQ